MAWKDSHSNQIERPWNRSLSHGRATLMLDGVGIIMMMVLVVMMTMMMRLMHQ